MTTTDSSTVVNYAEGLFPAVAIPEGMGFIGVAWRVCAERRGSYGGYQWPAPGNWTPVDEDRIERTNIEPCPTDEGDGVCLAKIWQGAAAGGLPVSSFLICGYREVLGEDDTKLRVPSAYVLAEVSVRDLDFEDLSKRGLLRWAYLYGADLSEANLRKVNLLKAYLGEAHLRRANLSGADLTEANLSGADLTEANLSGADLSEVNLGGANLSWADLSGANLGGANLSWADLGGADLSGARLHGADLSGADLSGAKGTQR